MLIQVFHIHQLYHSHRSYSFHEAIYNFYTFMFDIRE
jgi:hypothetical protein